MDCRWTRWILGGVCAGLVGCSTPSKWLAGRSDVDDDDFARSGAKVSADEPIPKSSKMKPETWVALADVRVQMASDPNRASAEAERLREQARELYQRALDKDPKNLAAHKGLIRLHVNAGDSERAKAAFAKVLAREPKNAGLWHDQGIYLARQKDWPGAIESLSAAAQLDPDNRIYCKSLGFTLARSGQPDEALPWLTRAMPEGQARLNLAKMLNHTEQRDACAQQLQLALRADPRLDEARAMLEEMRGGGVPAPRGEIQQTGYSPEPARPTSFADPGVTPIPAAPPQPAPAASLIPTAPPATAPGAAPVRQVMAVRTEVVAPQEMPALSRPPQFGELEAPEPITAPIPIQIPPVSTADWDDRPAPQPKVVPPQGQ